ncbi:unnamed protein product [Symbiodinium natans]|uniref:Uncharacterized protein n=1 Tax=Symbiodinium natans TaxID=878477 RepID=A0A812VFE2_9DINO|nr:unnamed protein product [Symbiodinium natans]
MAALRTQGVTEMRDSRQSPGCRSIGSLVGRRGVAHCAAASQAHSEGTSLQRARSAGLEMGLGAWKLCSA